jgi:hypothetical protein
VSEGESPSPYIHVITNEDTALIAYPAFIGMGTPDGPQRIARPFAAAADGPIGKDAGVWRVTSVLA